MLITAEQKNSRQSPRKVRLVADAIRKLSLKQAIEQLGVMDKKATIVVMKVLRQAIANAVNNAHLNVDDLSIKDIVVNEGPRYKRFRAVSRGRGHTIIKKTCHVRVVLQSKTDAQVVPAAQAVEPEVVEDAQPVSDVIEAQEVKRAPAAPVIKDMTKNRQRTTTKVSAPRRVQNKGK